MLVEHGAAGRGGERRRERAGCDAQSGQLARLVDINVASGTPRTVLDMARALAAACAAPLHAGPQVTGEWRAGDVRTSSPHPGAHERLGFRAREGFEKGMRELAAPPLRT